MLHTVKSAYNFFNRSIGINKIRNLMTSGDIPSTLIGNRWVTEEKHLLRWKNEQFISNTESIKKKK